MSKSKENCDNSSRNANRIMRAGCFDNYPTHELTIDYGHKKSVLRLCKECCSLISKDAKKHKYTTTTKVI